MNDMFCTEGVCGVESLGLEVFCGMCFLAFFFVMNYDEI